MVFYPVIPGVGFARHSNTGGHLVPGAGLLAPPPTVTVTKTFTLKWQLANSVRIYRVLRWNTSALGVTQGFDSLIPGAGFLQQAGGTPNALIPGAGYVDQVQSIYAVSVNYTVKWNLFNSVSRTFTLPWNIRSLVSQSATLVWTLEINLDPARASAFATEILSLQDPVARASAFATEILSLQNPVARTSAFATEILSRLPPVARAGSLSLEVLSIQGTSTAPAASQSKVFIQT